MDGRKTSNWWTLWGALILVWALFPLVWMVSLSFKSPTTFRAGTPRSLPRSWTWDNYRTVFRNSLFTAALRNSFGIALLATLLSLALAIAMFPQAALVGPLFDMWRGLGIYDTWIGLIIPYLTFFFCWNEFLILELLFQGRIVAGLTAGAVKG